MPPLVAATRTVFRTFSRSVAVPSLRGSIVRVVSLPDFSDV